MVGRQGRPIEATPHVCERVGNGPVPLALDTDYYLPAPLRAIALLPPPCMRISTRLSGGSWTIDQPSRKTTGMSCSLCGMWLPAFTPERPVAGAR